MVFTDMEALHNAFTRFVPSAVVDEIVARGVAVGAEKKEVTVLFADLKGFTAMSEALAIRDAVHRALPPRSTDRVPAPSRVSSA